MTEPALRLDDEPQYPQWRPEPIRPPDWIPTLDELRTLRADDTSATHRAAVARIAAELGRYGWACNRETWIAGGRRIDGKRKLFRVDLIARHPDLLEDDGRQVIGAIEVKPQIGNIGEASAALKQASDYVHCWTVTGELVRWAAVAPFGPFKNNEQRCFGAAHQMGTEFKAGVFIRGRPENAGMTWDWNHPRLSLRMNMDSAAWSDSSGFARNAAQQLYGKRQVGGSRR